MWVFGHEPQANHAAPVLAEVGDVGEIKVVEQGVGHPCHVTRVAVVGDFSWLVGASKSHEVWSHYAVTSGDQQGNHVAIQERPRWLAMHQQHWGCVGRTFVDVMHSQRATVAVVDLEVVRLERIVGQVGKSFVGGAKCLH